MSKLATKIHHTYSFNNFSIDLDRGCLLRAGHEVKLRPKVFNALCYLVENNKRLVTKAELIQAVWPDSFVTDDSLVQCLVELRRALGDDAPYIKTVPRRGYIFDAVVTRDWAQSEAGAAFRTLVQEGTAVEARTIRVVGERSDYRAQGQAPQNPSGGVAATISTERGGATSQAAQDIGRRIVSMAMDRF